MNALRKLQSQAQVGQWQGLDRQQDQIQREDTTKYTLAVSRQHVNENRTKSSQANTDGDAGSMGMKTVEGVTLQDPPQITSFAHEDLVRWRHERIMYEETVQNRCAETGESIASVQRPG
ncbi:unnamed protein product [Phytophthora lilii]|uniref:Unnamed protein product n=1 Tax=Phytophthora lilii TaxID=2077276 RepID=A0A9W6X2R1_9STRA|nr:unnamed protein product [Phytophthora lilii]